MKIKLLMAAALSLCLCFSACSERGTTDRLFKKENIIGTGSVYPIDEQNFTSSQKRWVDLTKAFFIVDLKISEEITEQQKASFFLYIISTPLYEDKVEEWKNGAGYTIPLKDIEEIIFSHLDTQSFDPEQGFLNRGISQYNPNLQEYSTSMIGGYGGAAALGVLEYGEDANTGTTTIVLGSYEMNEFFNDPPIYILKDTYEVTFLIEDDEQGFKVLKAS